MIKKFNLVPKLIVLFLFGLFLAVGCSTEETSTENDPVDSTPEPEPEPEPVVYFTFSTDDTVDTTDGDYWVIIHDSNGNVLDHKPYESGDVLEFKALDSELTDKITVTLFSNRVQTFVYAEGDEIIQCEGPRFNLVSYPDITKGNNWLHSKYLSRLQSPSPNNLGLFTLNLENIPGQYPIRNNFYKRSENGNWGNLSTVRLPAIGGSGELSYSSGFTTMTDSGIINWEDTDYFMSILHVDDGLKYLFFQNPDEGSNITIDYGDLQSFDSYSYFPTIPENEGYSLELLGFEDETSFKTHYGYFCLSIRDDNSGEEIPLGFLDRFTHYNIFFDIDLGNYEYNYRLFGPKPNVTSIPEKPSTSFTQDGINGFDFTTTTNYVRKTDYFEGQEPLGPMNCSITRWSMESNQENYPTLSGLPDELYTNYPDLVPFDQLKYHSSQIYLQGKEYSEFLRDEFDPSYDHILKFGDVQESFTIYRE